jgi:hypothetical protein
MQSTDPVFLQRTEDAMRGKSDELSDEAQTGNTFCQSEDGFRCLHGTLLPSVSGQFVKASARNSRTMEIFSAVSAQRWNLPESAAVLLTSACPPFQLKLIV